MPNKKPFSPVMEHIAQGLGRSEGQSGQSVVIIALALIGLVAFAALIIDGGTAYAERRHMQNAADAGALAGARVLADHGTCAAVRDAINTYAITKNTAARYDGTFIFLDGAESAIPSSCAEPPTGAYAVRVTAYTSFNTFFATMLGNPTGAVSAQAAAAFGTINSPRNNVMPIAPQCDGDPNDPAAPCGFRHNVPYDIWDGGGPGNFGWLGWDNNSTNSSDSSTTTLCANFSDSDQMVYTNPDDSGDHTLSVGDWVPGSTGVKNANCVGDNLRNLIDTQTPVTVIIWGMARDQGGNLAYQVVGFAKFTLTGYNLPPGNGNSGSAYGDTSGCGTGSGNCIQGFFQSWMDAADICIGCYDFGVKTVKLVNIPPPTPTPGALPPVPPTRTPTSTPTNTPTNTPTSTPSNTPTKTPTPSSQICVLAYNDANGNGSRGGSEDLLAGAQIVVRDASNAIVGTWTSNSTDTKCFASLPAGTYTVNETNPANYTSTTADSVSVTLGIGSSVTVQFGDRPGNTATPTATATATATSTNTPSVTPTSTLTNTPPPNTTSTPTNTPTLTPTATATPLPGRICAKVWNDADLSGTQNGSEDLLGGYTITVTNQSGVTVAGWTVPVADTTTHCSSDLLGGIQYVVTEINPAGFPASTTSDLVTIPSLPSSPITVEFGDVVCMAVPGKLSDIGTGVNTLDYTLNKGQGRVTLLWGSTSPSADAFAVYRMRLDLGETVFTQVATVGGVSWVDNTATMPSGATWKYYVRPYNHCGSGLDSNPLSITN